MSNVSNDLGFDQNTLLTSFWSLHGLITPRLQYANEIPKQLEENYLRILRIPISPVELIGKYMEYLFCMISHTSIKKCFVAAAGKYSANPI